MIVPRRIRFLDWAAIAALSMALPLITPFLAPGLAATADGEIHLQRILSAAFNLQAGQWWPRWTPYLHQGYGYPIHNFYPPGLHIVGALLVLWTHADPVLALKLIQIVATLLYPLGAYYFARTLTGRTGALVAVAAYVYVPFRFHELWVEGNLSQFAAMALLPWLLWALVRAVERRRLIWVLGVGACFAAIVVLHHPTAFLFAPVAGLYALLLSSVQNRRWKDMLQALVMAAAGLALGLALSAIYWLPALLELQYVQINSIGQDSLFSVAANFLPLDYLLAANAPVDRTMLNTPSVLQAGQPQVAAALIGLLALLPGVRANRMQKASVIGGALIVVLSLFLITPDSQRLWTTLPLAKFIVYPWRLLGIIAVAALPGASIIPSLVRSRYRSVVAGAGVTVCFIMAMPLFYLPLTFRQIPPMTPASAIEFEQQTGNVGLTSGDEYLPRWASQRPLNPLRNADYTEWRVWLSDVPPGVSSQPLPADQPGVSRYEVQSSAPFTLTFHQMYFPGWRVTIDGQDAGLGQRTPYGLITVPMPEGRHELAIWYGGTPVQHLASFISIIALGVSLAGVIAWLVRRKTMSASAEVPAPTSCSALWICAAIIGFIIINHTLIVPYTSLFRPRSDPAMPPAQHRVNMAFGDTIELLGYDLSTSTARPGQLIYVQLYWRLLKPTTQSLRGAVLLTSSDGTQVWGRTESLELGDLNTRTWPLDRYVVDRYPVAIAADAPPFAGKVRVAVFPLAPSIQYLKTPDGVNEAPLTDVRLLGDRKLLPDGAIKPGDVIFGGSIKLLGFDLQPNGLDRRCITLRWNTLVSPAVDYAVMLHVRDASNQAIGVVDGAPMAGLYPTSQWQNGQILDDVHCFEATKGAASIAVGLYSLMDGERLPAFSTSGEHLPDESFIVPLTDPMKG